MSSLSYNDIVIGEPLKEVAYKKTPVFDGPTYLYTRHEITVEGLYNPQAVSYLAPVGNNPPVATTGQMGPQTDAAIRHQLAQPQQQLIYTIGAGPNHFDLLVSPADFMQVDAANGPLPGAIEIVESVGAKTFTVRFTVTTCINESDLYIDTPSVILSHRWRMAHHIDRHAFCTRVITGHAVFRSDRLEFLDANPDDYRGFLFHPIPTGFERLGIDVEVDEDNLALDYTITDRQPSLCILAPLGLGITDVQGHYSQRQSSVGFEQAAWQAGGSLVNIGMGVLHGIGLGDRAKVGDVAGFVNTASAEAARGIGNVPRRFHEMTISCWGPKGQNPQTMTAAAKLIIQRQLTAVGVAFAAHDYIEDHHYTKTEIVGTASVRLTSGPVASIVTIGGALAGQGVGSGLPVFNFGPADELQPIATYGTATVAQPLNADNSHSRSYLYTIIANSFLEPNAIPEAPVGAPPYDPRTPP